MAMRKATGMVRKVDGLGRIVIPKEIRKNYGIDENDGLEIFTDGDGHIILKKYQRGCMSCGNMEPVYVSEGIELCQKCVDKIIEFQSPDLF